MMFIKALLLFLIPLASALAASPANGQAEAAQDNTCKGFALHKRTYYRNAMKACEKLFEKKTPTGHTQVTAHVWIGYSDSGKNINPDPKKLNYFVPCTFHLDGNVKNMSRSMCEYAFTNWRVFIEQKTKGNTCSFKGGRYGPDSEITGWSFEKEGRKYRLTTGRMFSLAAKEKPTKDPYTWEEKYTFYT